MYKIALICPYFGKLPDEHFQLMLDSCRYNPTVDWFLITDDKTKYNYPPNVIVEYMSFENVVELVKSKLGDDVYLGDPYKFVDYKPIYGYIFQDRIKEYDFWGHCDMTDAIYGNIRKFLTDDVLKSNDRVLFLGHLSLYKNVTYINELFMQDTPSSMNWKEILCKPFTMGFDENEQYGVGIGFKFRDMGYKLYRDDDCYADILPDHFRFSEDEFDEQFHNSLVKNNRFICEWDKGKLYKISIEGKKITKRELCYFHFQKRKLDNLVTSGNEHYLLVPNKIIDCDYVDYRLVLKYSKNNLLYKQALKIKYKNYKYRIEKKLGKIEAYK